MSQEEQTNTKIDKEQFIDVFNDIETFPTVADVAAELGISKSKASQVANRYRSQGEAVINRRKKDAPLAGAYLSEDDESTITFFIDEDLNIRVRTRVNMKKMSQVLIDNDYIPADAGEDEFAAHLAFLLLVNEVTAQKLDEYN